MKRYIDYIDDYDDCTREDMIEIINQLSDKLNYVLNVIYNSPDGLNGMYFDDLDR